MPMTCSCGRAIPDAGDGGGLVVRCPDCRTEIGIARQGRRRRLAVLAIAGLLALAGQRLANRWRPAPAPVPDAPPPTSAGAADATPALDDDALRAALISPSRLRRQQGLDALARRGPQAGLPIAIDLLGRSPDPAPLREVIARFEPSAEPALRQQLSGDAALPVFRALLVTGRKRAASMAELARRVEAHPDPAALGRDWDRTWPLLQAAGPVALPVALALLRLDVISVNQLSAVAVRWPSPSLRPFTAPGQPALLRWVACQVLLRNGQAAERTAACVVLAELLTARPRDAAIDPEAVLGQLIAAGDAGRVALMRTWARDQTAGHPPDPALIEALADRDPGWIIGMVDEPALTATALDLLATTRRPTLLAARDEVSARLLALLERARPVAQQVQAVQLMVGWALERPIDERIGQLTRLTVARLGAGEADFEAPLVRLLSASGAVRDPAFAALRATTDLTRVAKIVWPHAFAQAGRTGPMVDPRARIDALIVLGRTGLHQPERTRQLLQQAEREGGAVGAAASRALDALAAAED